MNLINVYSDFLKFREALIEKLLKNADFKEDKGNEFVRPLVICKSESEFLEYKALVDRWHKMVDILTTGDPVRFKPSARIFKPAPTLINGAFHVKIREMEASSGKKVEKISVLKRMHNALEAEKEKGNRLLVDRYKQEIELMENDGEEFYYRRAKGYKEYRAMVYMDEDSKEPIKHSLNYSGMVILPADKRETPFLANADDKTEQRDRSDKFENSGIQAIQCSLPSRCRFYKYSEYEAIKAKKPKEDILKI